MEEEANEDATPGVFRNQDVLREIFKYLPTSTLISSCSLVNKFWREEARSFVRDCRECTVNLGIGNSGQLNLWNQLCELDSALGKMQTVPFNSLHVVITCRSTRCDEAAEMNDLINLISRFPLKYILILEQGEMAYVHRCPFEDRGIDSCGRRRCPAISAVLELVQKNSSTLVEFESRTFLVGKNYGVFKDWEPPERFENLKKLSIARNSSITPDCAKKIIHGASKLRAIHSNCRHIIPDVIPENMYGTLKRLGFGDMDVDHIEKFVDKLDHLEELLLDFWSSYEVEVDMRTVALLQKLLELNKSTLVRLNVTFHHGAALFNQIHLPLLPSVQALSIAVGSFESLVHITALNFRESLPNLHQVHITRVDPCSYYNNDADAVQFREDAVIVAPNASESTLELNIACTVSVSDLATLRRLFPSVITIKHSFQCQSQRHFTPLGLTAVLWPNLQSLSLAINGMVSATDVELFQEKVGAQVFGLHPEEWKLLRQQDQEFLKRVQLAPTRPCVWTMRELKSFQLEYYASNLPRPEAFCQFLEPLIIARMPGLSFKLKKVLVDPLWTTPRFGDLSEEMI